MVCGCLWHWVYHITVVMVKQWPLTTSHVLLARFPSSLHWNNIRITILGPSLFQLFPHLCQAKDILDFLAFRKPQSPQFVATASPRAFASHRSKDHHEPNPHTIYRRWPTGFKVPALCPRKKYGKTWICLRDRKNIFQISYRIPKWWMSYWESEKAPQTNPGKMEPDK